MRKVSKKVSERARRAVAARKGPITINTARPMRLTGAAGERFVEAQLLALGWDTYRPSDTRQAPYDLVAMKANRQVRVQVKAVSSDGATGWSLPRPLEAGLLVVLLIIGHDGSWPDAWIAWGKELARIGRVSDSTPDRLRLTRRDMRLRHDFRDAWKKIDEIRF